MTDDTSSDMRFVDTLGHRPILGLISNADRIMRGMRDALLQPFGISTTEYALLARLRDAGDRSGAELAREIYLTPQAIGQMVARLESKGVIARGSDPVDARRLPVSLTREGRELMREGRAALVPVEEVMLEGLSDREILLFGLILEIVAGNLERAFWEKRFAPPATEAEQSAS